MSTDTTLGVLERWGDTLERSICHSRHFQTEEASDLAQILYPYSGIWHDHILPRRDRYDLSCLDAQYSNWSQFASSHYSALVKFYQAVRKYRELLDCCKEAERGALNAELLMSAHDATAGFWEHMGSAIDNLGRCFDDAPGLNYRRGDGLKSIQAAYESLSFAYNRRTQMIHYCVVPVGFDDGTIVFNERHFDQMETNWRAKRYSPEWINEYHVKAWKAVVSQLGSVWNRLRDELKQVDPDPPAVPKELDDQDTRILDGDLNYSGSGMLSVVQSNSTRSRSGTKEPEPYWVRGRQVPPSGYPGSGTGGW